jgi:hypothetical protein
MSAELEITQEQLDAAAEAYLQTRKFAVNDANVAGISEGLRAAAPFLQVPIEWSEYAEMGEAMSIAVGEYQLRVANAILARRNAARQPKPSDPRRELLSEVLHSKLHSYGVGTEGMSRLLDAILAALDAKTEGGQ